MAPQICGELRLESYAGAHVSQEFRSTKPQKENSKGNCNDTKQPSEPNIQDAVFRWPDSGSLDGCPFTVSSRKEMEYFVTVSSPFYPELATHYEQVISKWVETDPMGTGAEIVRWGQSQPRLGP